MQTLCRWHYVTKAYFKNGSIDYVLTKLNFFHSDISFTYENKKNHQLSFLDALFIRNGTGLDTEV